MILALIRYSMQYILNIFKTQGKYARCLYYDHVIKCFVSDCVLPRLVHRHLDDTFRDNAFCNMIIIQAASVLALWKGYFQNWSCSMYWIFSCLRSWCSVLPMGNQKMCVMCVIFITTSYSLISVCVKPHTTAMLKVTLI